MNTDLLAVLNETLNELTEQQQEFSTLIQQCHEEVAQAETEVVFQERQKTYFEQQRVQGARKSEVLRNYISGLKKQPCALLNKVKRLNEQQLKISEDLREVESQLVKKRTLLQSRQTQLAEAEQRSEEIRKEWNEVSEHIGLVEHAE